MAGRIPSRTLWIFAVLIGASACPGARFNGHTVVRPDVTYEVGAPSGGWRRVQLADNDVAFVSESSGHSMAVNATCEGHDDPPLAVLLQHLLIGFTNREEAERQTIWLDGREALKARFRARLDGVPIEMQFVVMKKDGCVYDFTYLGPSEHFDDRLADFGSLLQGFHARERG